MVSVVEPRPEIFQWAADAPRLPRLLIKSQIEYNTYSPQFKACHFIITLSHPDIAKSLSLEYFHLCIMFENDSD